MTKKSSSGGTLLLIALFLLGFLFHVFVVVDVHWTHYLIQSPFAKVAPIGDGEDEAETPQELERLKESILLVLVPRCDGAGVASGTAFVVKAGYLATAAHVVGDNLTCGSQITLIDSTRFEHQAVLEGYSDTDDLAILNIGDRSLQPLPLADSAAFEGASELASVVTIGYPLVGAASEAGEPASISGQGNVSRYDAGTARFTTSGLNLNPGNSGGPVFLSNTWEVLGVASAGLDSSVGDSISFIIPINRFKDFFRERTGQEP